MNPVIHYVLHKKYYATELCKNRKKPMMKCHGKCHLKKEILEENRMSGEKEKSLPIVRNNRVKEPVYLICERIFRIENLHFNDNDFIYLEKYIQLIYIEVLKPPPKILSIF